MDDRIKALLSERPDLNAEEFIARRILRHMGFVGKGVKAEVKDRELSSPWELARKKLIELCGPAVSLLPSVDLIYAMAEDDRQSTLEHVFGLFEDGPVLLFARGMQDAVAVFLSVPKHKLFALPVLEPPMMLYPIEDHNDMVIMQKPLRGFLHGLIELPEE